VVVGMVTRKVYDIVNVGERHQFAIKGKDGKMMIVHNCNGALYTENGSSDFIEIHDEKLKALEDIVNDNEDENLLVAYNFKSDLVRIKARFPQARILGKEGLEIEDWNKGKIKMLLAHPASAGMGLNLQQGGSVIVWFGMTWSLENYAQFNGRIHRQGQTKPVRVIHILTGGTIDERVLKVLSQKDSVQSTLLNALKV
jgi:SNF2 family DNA or RNA helicase